MVLESQRPIGVRYNTLYFNGFGTAAPCKGNVSANRMQSDESLLSRAMLRCSLTSPEAIISQPRVKQTEGLRHPGFSPNEKGLNGIAPCKGNMSK